MNVRRSMWPVVEDAAMSVLGFTGAKRWRNATVTSGGPDDLTQKQDRAAEPIADGEQEGPVHDQCGGSETGMIFTACLGWIKLRTPLPREGGRIDQHGEGVWIQLVDDGRNPSVGGVRDQAVDGREG